MIKNNTLPDIFDKKKKKKKKKKQVIDYYVHVETTNPSFLKMHILLKTLGIANNTFFLALYDTSLADVDPYDPNLTRETKARILKEISTNFWYFIREVVRIPESGSEIGIGEGTQYELHRGNLALNFCMFNNINSFTELPRQTGKSIAVDIFLLWLYNYATTNSEIMMMNKDHKYAKENLARIRAIRDSLPEFMQFKYKYNEDGKKLKLGENRETAENERNNNKIVTYSKATSEEHADAMGRGATQPTQWYDEFGFIRYNSVIYEAASPAASKASESAAKNGKPYAKIITTTPGDMRTQTGRTAYEFLKKCATFEEEFYDWEIDDVKEYVYRNSENNFIYIKFSYKQVGKSQKYFEKCVKDLSGNWAKIKREVLLEWNDKVDNSPFDEDDLDTLMTMKRIHKRKIYINKYYVLYMFEEIDPRYKTIISVDVATGHGGDSSVIVLINTRTKNIIGILHSNRIDTVTLASAIYTIATKVVPNCLICIENNGVGDGPIANLTHTDVKNKLYYQTNKDDKTKDKVKDGSVIRTDISNRKYGVHTSGTARALMFEKLCIFVQQYKYRIAVEPFIEQLKNLQFTKQGRIEHGPGLHDDIILAYLIGIYAYYYGDMQRFGIIRFPDVPDDEDISEDEYLDKFEEEITTDKEEVANRLQRIIQSSGTQYVDYDEADLPKELLAGYEQKTINDYYNELDEEVSNAVRGASSTKNILKNINKSSYEEEVEHVFVDYY